MLAAVSTGTGVAVISCLDCGGTGSPGTAGGYRLRCQGCNGSGMAVTGYMAVRQF